MVEAFKTFNWDEAEKYRSPRRVAFWRAHFDEPLSEDEYVAAMQEIRKESTKTRNFNPSKCRYDYRSLKSRFGFFK